MLKKENMTSVPCDGNSDKEPKNHAENGGIFAYARLFFEDFSSGSTIHGVRYLGEKNRHWTEKTFWIIAFFASTFGCSVMIWKIYDKWQSSPVMVSMAESPTPYWQIPFPAVTICPETKTLSEEISLAHGNLRWKVWKSQHHGDTSSEIYDSDEEELHNDEEMKILEALTQICDPEEFQVPAINSSLDGSETVHMLQKVAPRLKNMFFYGSWTRSKKEISFTGRSFWLCFCID